MTAAILSFFGVIIGASLQYFFTRHLDNQKHYMELRSKAYIDYMRCVSEHAIIRPQRQSQNGRELFVRKVDAKGRICLYGSAEAVNAFAEFERVGVAMKTPEQCAVFSRMVAIMRRDSTKGDPVASRDLEVVLYGCDGSSC